MAAFAGGPEPGIAALSSSTQLQEGHGQKADLQQHMDSVLLKGLQRKRLTATLRAFGSWSENILDYFLRNNQIRTEDGAEIIWYHAANHKSQMHEALKSAAHMIEADVLLPSDGSEHGQPIMAHPPETNSDNTLQEWLAEVMKTNKGIKLDFKSLAAVRASMLFLQNVRQHLQRPVWMNADILPGPNGSSKVVDARAFLDTVTSFFPDVTFSLGWTTGWHPEKVNEGYSWTMVKEMDYICSGLTQPVTFPVRAALFRQSSSQLLWLLKKSNRRSSCTHRDTSTFQSIACNYKGCGILQVSSSQKLAVYIVVYLMMEWYSLTIWTGKDDSYTTDDLLYIRDCFNKTQVFYDILEPQNHEFKHAIGIPVSL
ncbi:protein FAM151B isoform X2 [Peromyscus maniculatus bairdii]|uniref:protein FAM151B isoform X2 n=1 Tax=Peromyscus maniculatus bairdii TaxID=230844 RepID=UPI003FD36A01